MPNIAPSDILVVQRPAGSDAGTYKTPFSDLASALRVVVADVPPENPVEGDLYWDTGDARLFVYVTSVGVANWVPTTPVPDGFSEIDGGIYA